MTQVAEDKWSGIPAADAGMRTPVHWSLGGSLGLLILSSLGRRLSDPVACVSGAFLAGQAEALAAIALLPFERLAPALAGYLRRKRPEPEAPRPSEAGYHVQAIAPRTREPEGAASADGPVETGSFRVDASRAIKTLSRYQLADPYGLLKEWVRCAAASGASRVSIDPDSGGVWVRFDGRPIPDHLLQDPLGALLGGDEGRGAQGRHLAAGLLAAMRLAPARIALASGEGDARAQISWSLLPREADEPLPGPGTVIRVDWAKDRTALCLERAGRDFALAPLELRIAGSVVPGAPRAGGWSRFEHGDVRGLFGWAGDGAQDSRVRLYVLGAFVEEVPWRFPGAQVIAHIEDPRLALDISHGHVAIDARLQETLRAVAEAIPTERHLRGRRLAFLRRKRRLEGPRHGRWLDVSLGALWAASAAFVYHLCRRYDGGVWGARVFEFAGRQGTAHAPLLFALGYLAAALHLRLTGRCARILGKASSAAMVLAMAGLAAWYFRGQTGDQFLGLALGPDRVTLRYRWPASVAVPLKDIRSLEVGIANWEHEQIPAWDSWRLDIVTPGARYRSYMDNDSAQARAAEAVSEACGVPAVFRRELWDVGTGTVRSSRPTTLREHLEWAGRFSDYQQGPVPKELGAR